MKNLNLLLIIIIGLTIFSCSSDDSNSNEEPQLNEKKLIRTTEEGDYGIYEKLYIYDSENNVSEIESSFTEFEQPTSDIYNTIYTYENNLIVSAIHYQNGILFRTFVFNYSNDNLNERIIYDSNGIEDEKLEFTYNSDNKVESFNFYVDSQFQQTQNFVYDTNGNIIIAEDTDHSEIQYDTNPSPSHNFTNFNGVIFETENLLLNLCENNETSRTTTYNYSLPGEITYQYQTSITYDTNNYPLSKILTETDDNNNQRIVRTTTFQYE
jgi:hypothetical protein